MGKNSERFKLMVQINEAIWNKETSENNKYAKLLDLLKSTYPYFDEMSAEYYYMYFSLLIQYLETDTYSFENAAGYFNLLVQRTIGENKGYWTCADYIRRNTLHGKEFYEELKQSIAYLLEGMFVDRLDTIYEYENNFVKRNTR